MGYRERIVTSLPEHPDQLEAAPGAGRVGQPRLLRAINEQALLNALRRFGRLTRAELAELSGLSKPTVGAALVHLEGDGLVQVVGRRTGGRGPTALVYELRPDAGFVLALDVGSEFVRGGVADLSGTIRARGHRGVHAASGHARMSGLVELAGELVERAGISLSSIVQTIVGSPGVHDPVHDVLTVARGLPGWERPGVLADLRRSFGAATLVQNDVNLAALAERDHGQGRGVETFAFVSVGTGVGMGLVLSGQLHTGAHGTAGEIAYLPIATDDGIDLRDARRRGALEAAASAAGVVRAARSRGMTGRLTALRVFAAAAAGDERARAVVAGEALLVARAIASVALVADPALVILGGGIGGAPGFSDAVASALAGLVPAPPELRVSAFGSEAIVEGGIVAGVDLAWGKVLDRS
jgi:predicted NBD/HSP70 family sugar kinase